MRLLALEHSPLVHALDFAIYGAVVAGLTIFLGCTVRSDVAGIAACLLAGMLAWTMAEYLLHRFVLHGIEPFMRWHEVHHDRPRALVATPTLVSASLIFTFVFVPAQAVASTVIAIAFTLGFVIGYVAYAAIHHGIHHRRAGNVWLHRRKRWHALHHHADGGCYGVTSAFWDRVFGTGAPN